MIPPLHGLVLVEYFHRLVTLLATLFILYNAFRSWRKRRGDKVVASLALGSVFFLLTQIAFGAIIVVLVLPGAFTTVDVTNSLVLLSILAALTAVGYRERHLGPVVEHLPSRSFGETELAQIQSVRRPLFWSASLVFLEAIIGGYFRHSGESQALYGQNSYLLSHHQHVMPSLVSSVAMLIVHIGVSILVAACVVWLLVAAAKARKYIAGAVVMVLLTAYQALIGILSLQTALGLYADTLHWAGAALMITVSAYLVTILLIDTRRYHKLLTGNGGSEHAAGGRTSHRFA